MMVLWWWNNGYMMVIHWVYYGYMMSRWVKEANKRRQMERSLLILDAQQAGLQTSVIKIIINKQVDDHCYHHHNYLHEPFSWKGSIINDPPLPHPEHLILSSKDSLSLGRRSSVSSGEEREEAPTTILKKISKSYEHLDRWGKVRTSDHWLWASWSQLGF